VVEQVRLIGRDEGNGREDMGGGVVLPVEGEDDKDAYADL